LFYRKIQNILFFIAVSFIEQTFFRVLKPQLKKGLKDQDA